MLSGAGLMQQETGLSIDAVRIVQALVLLFVAADVIVRTIFRIRRAAERRPRSRPPSSARGWAEADVSTRRFQLGRRQTLGVVFGLLGARTSSATCAGNLDDADKGLTFEPPPDPLEADRSTRRIVVAVIGIVFVARGGGRRSSSAARPRSCAGAARRRPVLFVPLVIVVALALSDASEHQRDAAAGRVAAARHPGRARARWPACGASGPAS